MAGETEEHWFLKQVGLALLLKKGCSPAWTEVRLPVWDASPTWEYEEDGDETPLLPTEYRIVDVAGIKPMYRKADRRALGYDERFETILAIEVKVSRSDFQKGFVTNGWGKLWMLTPPGLIETKELPPGVGLYECDPETGRLQFRSPASFSGFRPSQHALDNLKRDMTWAGYGAGITAKLADERLRLVLRPDQRTLEVS